MMTTNEHIKRMFIVKMNYDTEVLNKALRLTELGSDKQTFNAHTRTALLAQSIDLLIEHINSCSSLLEKMSALRQEALTEYGKIMEAKRNPSAKPESSDSETDDELKTTSVRRKRPVTVNKQLIPPKT